MSRINFSSREVITPNPETYRIDEVCVPYTTFLEKYKFHILNLLCKIDGMTLIDAEEKWNKACTKFDRRIYQLMNYLVENTKGGLRTFINRRKYCGFILVTV